MANNTTQLINGPANLARIEGDINGVHKVLYAFMDWHVDLQWQSRCNDFLSDTMPQYIIKTLKNNKDTTYDFFMEIRPNNIMDSLGWTQHKYIMEMGLFFQQLFKYNNEKDKVLTSDEYPNIRVHYMDLRDSLEFGIIHEGYAPLDNMMNLVDNCYSRKYASENVLRQIETSLNSAIDQFNVIKNLLTSKKSGGSKIFEKVTKKETTIITDETINKIKNVYKNNDVMLTMHDLMNEVITFECRNIDERIENYRKFLEEGIALSRNNKITIIELFGDKKIIRGSGSALYYVMKLYAHTDKIYDMFTDFFAWITDFYFLRRFLDKDYIANGISYTGGLHSSHYIYALVKYFDFKITHIHKTSIKDIDKLNKFVKKSSVFDEEFDINFIPNEMIQCVNMENFPKNLQ